MSDLKVIWEDDALKLLMDRDRFTRSVIQDEFRSNPERNKFPLDPANPDEGEFLTQVSNNRFTVWWRLEGKLAVVHAVLPLPLTDSEKRSPDLKQHVQRAVAEAREGIASPRT